MRVIRTTLAVALCLLVVVLAPGAHAAGAGTYPDEPFEGVQVTYSISGVELGAASDTDRTGPLVPIGPG